MTSGDEQDEARRINSTATNSITFADALSGAPSATETLSVYEAILGEYKKLMGYGEFKGVYASDITNDEWSWF